MSKLMVIIALLGTTFAAHADRDDDREKLNRAKAAYAQGVEAALESKLLDKRTSKIKFPGTGTYISANGVCNDGESIHSIYPIQFCVQWRAKVDDEWKYFDSKRKAEGRNDRSVTCTRKGDRFFSHQINYTNDVCSLWRAKVDDEWKYFDTKRKAEGRSDRNATCVETAMVAASMPTTYKIDFYAKDRKDRFDNEWYVGSYGFDVQACEM